MSQATQSYSNDFPHRRGGTRFVNNQRERFAMQHQRKSLSVLALIAALSMSGWTVLGQKQNKMTHRSRVTAQTSAWEYKVTGLLSENELNKLGAEGWEL